jgi:hypothetical protein
MRDVEDNIFVFFALSIGERERSTRNLPGGKGRPARKADNFIAICEPIV